MTHTDATMFRNTPYAHVEYVPPSDITARDTLIRQDEEWNYYHRCGVLCGCIDSDGSAYVVKTHRTMPAGLSAPIVAPVYPSQAHTTAEYKYPMLEEELSRYKAKCAMLESRIECIKLLLDVK